MEKKLLNEINRFREIIGLGDLNEAITGLGAGEKAIERFLERLGLRSIERTEIKALERAMANEEGLLKNFEDIGRKLSSADAKLIQQGEKQLDDFLLRYNNFTKIIDILYQHSPDEMSKVIDNVLKDSFPYYNDFLKAYEKGGTSKVLEIYDAVTPKGQGTRVRYMLSKWEPNVQKTVEKTTDKSLVNLEKNVEEYLNQGNIIENITDDIESYIDKKLQSGNLKLQGITKEELSEQIRSIVSGPQSYLNPTTIESINEAFQRLSPAKKQALLNKAQHELLSMSKQGQKINVGFWEKKWQSYRAGGWNSALQFGKDAALIYATGIVASLIYYVSTDGLISRQTLPNIKKSFNWLYELFSSSEVQSATNTQPAPSSPPISPETPGTSQPGTGVTPVVVPPTKDSTATW